MSMMVSSPIKNQADTDVLAARIRDWAGMVLPS